MLLMDQSFVPLLGLARPLMTTSGVRRAVSGIQGFSKRLTTTVFTETSSKLHAFVCFIAFSRSLDPGPNADMMNALVILSTDNCHRSPPEHTIISFRRFALLLPEFGDSHSCQTSQKRETRNMDLWVQFKWRGRAFPGNIKLEAMIQAVCLTLVIQLSLKGNSWRKIMIPIFTNNIQGK